MKIVWGILVVVLLAVGGCGDTEQEHSQTAKRTDGKLTVLTVNYPLAYFADRLGGEHVAASYPGPIDRDPAFWNPSADDVSAFQAADLVLLNGATYAKWVPKVTLPSSKLVNTSAELSDRYITVMDAETHAHGPGGEHAHAGTAFTTWLDLTMAMAQARAIRDAFTAARPAQAEFFAAQYKDLTRDLVDLDHRLTTLTSGQDDRPLVASHPVYQYFARRYDLNLEAVMWEPSEVPGGRQWEELRRLLEQHPAEWMIWEGEPAGESVSRLETLGVQSLVVDPCATPPATGDFLDVMEANVAALAAAFQD